MRKMQAIVVLGISFGLAATAGAQQSSAPSFFTGVDPHTITMTPVNTAKFASQFNTSSAIRTPTQPKASTLANFFHSFTTLSWPPKHGFSIFPANLFQQQPAAFTPRTTADLPRMQVQPNQALLPY
jgi:hypothetical protein